MNYKVVPIPSEIVQSVRENLKSPQYGHPASVSLATGYGPCRACLKTFAQGKEERILFTYNSFDGLSDLPLPGPVFIHRETCAEYSANGFPPDLLDLPMLFEAFGENSEIMKREAVQTELFDGQIESLLSLPGVNFVNLRNAEAGCFIARIDPTADFS
jgi:hypothetical protein